MKLHIISIGFYGQKKAFVCTDLLQANFSLILILFVIRSENNWVAQFY